MIPLSITSDFVMSHGDPEPPLRKIAEAGFTHIHWCHHWRSDFLYANSEIEQIGRWLREYGLKLSDTHGSEGTEKFWYSPHEYARLAGVELVKNRIDFTARLGGDAIVMHVYPRSQAPAQTGLYDTLMTQLRKTLDEVQPFALERGVRIAVENLVDFAGLHAKVITVADASDNADLIQDLFAEYSPEFLGFCYDSGHAHLGYDRREKFIDHMERLSILHLHDNDGTGDDHRLPFQDTIHWDKETEMIAASPYTKPLSFEVNIGKTGIDSEELFLAKALESGIELANMVALSRKNMDVDCDTNGANSAQRI